MLTYDLTRCGSCSSADEDDVDPDTKAARERERRQANNVRERSVRVPGGPGAGLGGCAVEQGGEVGSQ